MAKFILRLDDACPQMDLAKWNCLEELLDKYHIQPIVGIIPQNEDDSFSKSFDDAFWDKARMWQKKGWTIAQHGYTHRMKQHSRKGYFYLAVETITEFAGVPYEKQKEMLKQGKEIMKSENVFPVCFFAPAHTFDKNTVKAISEDPEYKFISDGHALHAYAKEGCVFVPSIFDSLHIVGGVQTFIIHPTNMNNEAFIKLESFLENNCSDFINAENYVESIEKIPEQGILGKMFELAIYCFRRTRMIMNGDR